MRIDILCRFGVAMANWPQHPAGYAYCQVNQPFLIAFAHAGRENFEERRAEVHRRFDPILQSGDNTRQEKIDIQNQMHEELRKISEDEDRATDSRLFS